MQPRAPHRAALLEELRPADRLSHEWARAERFWTPLSLIVVDTSALAHPWARRAVETWLAGACREVDVACRMGRSSFCVILPSTNRTGAEAELARLLADATEQLDTTHGRVGFGLAVAFDDANTASELRMIAERDARVDRERPDPQERPTIPELERDWSAPRRSFDALTIPHLQR